MNPEVDDFLRSEKRWKAEFSKLRTIILDCRLEEGVKWGQPCYSLDGKNIVLIHGFKEYCAMLFFKGALLKDPKHVLITQTENVQASRQIRFTNADEIAALEPTLKEYIAEAIEVEKSGLKIAFRETKEFKMPEELQEKMDAVPGLRDSFNALTPGRQRAYILFFSEPKQAKTRVSRIEKYVEHIMAGKGLQDI